MSSGRAMLLAACVAATVPAPASADDDPERADAAAADRGRALALGAAVLPGLLVHGSGHWVAGERRTARRMLVIEGVALGAMVVGGIPLAIAPRRFSAPGIPLLFGGTGVLAINWLNDVYGVAGADRVFGTPPARPAALELELGYGYVRDPRFDMGSFAVARGVWRRGRWRLAPETWLSEANQRVGVSGYGRIVGATPARSGAAGGSALDLRLGASWHRYHDADVTVMAAEAEVIGRVDLDLLSPSLRGAFGELFGGLAVDVVDYGADGADTDTWDMLLGGFAWGVYLGDGRGEARLFYDHRRDGFAAGLASGNRANGFLGSFGGEAIYYLGERLGLSAEAQFGSAWVTALGVAYRTGGRP